MGTPWKNLNIFDSYEEALAEKTELLERFNNLNIKIRFRNKDQKYLLKSREK